MAKEKYTKEQKKIIRKFRGLAVKAFAAVMLIGCVMGFLFFFRPSTSQVEKRKLTEFPKFTVTFLFWTVPFSPRCLCGIPTPFP